MTRLLNLIGMVATLAVLSCADGARAELKGRVSSERPHGAVVLYDGKGTNLFLSMAGRAKIDWPEVDGALVSTRDPLARPDTKRANHLVSKLHFRDAQIHVEFMLPEKGSGNSGVYIHGHYELQIYNSFGVEKVGRNDMGAVYGFSEPLANACHKPGVWQAYDITYRAPRRDPQGTIVEDGSITAWLNGVKVQDGTQVGEPRSKYHPYRHGVTPYLKKIWQRQKETCTGPLFLQDHDSPVRFRNVWVLPLDDCAFVYEPADRLEEGFFIPQKPRRAFTVGADPGSRVGRYESPLHFRGLIEDLRLYWGVLDEVSLASWAAPREWSSRRQ